MKFIQSLAALKRTAHRALLLRLGTKSRRPLQQLVALRVIAREEVRTQSALAERLMIDRPAVSRLVDRLEQDGLLVRQSCDDRRCIALAVTTAAQPELKALEDALSWLDGEIRARVPATELRATIRVMERLQAALSAIEDAPPGKERPPARRKKA